MQAQNFHTPTYSETDITGGGSGLIYAAHNATDTRSELGARFDRPILVNWNAVLALRGKVAWAHDWITDPSLMPTFEALPGASFIVNGATPAKNSALTSAAAELARFKKPAWLLDFGRVGRVGRVFLLLESESEIEERVVHASSA